MIPEFGQYVRAVRLIRGLRIVDVVRLMGVQRKNEAKPIRLMMELERSGRCPPCFFNRVAEVLELDPEILAQLADAHETNVERVLDLSVTPTLTWFHQWAPTKFGMTQRYEHLPVGTTVPQALQQGSRFAKLNRVEVRVHVSRRQCVVVDEEGNIKRIERTRRSFATQHVVILGRSYQLRIKK
jgi:hypothetical protein